MKLPLPGPLNKGFTLIELLIVITVIAVLSTIAYAVYTNSFQNAYDAKRRGDIDAITKALEKQFNDNNTYPTALSDAFFTSQKIPTDPTGSQYTLTVPADGSWYRVCATLNSGSQYCKISVQGVAPTVTPTFTPVPPTPTPACILASTVTGGLLDYWNFEQIVNGNQITDQIGGRQSTYFINGMLIRANTSALGNSGVFNGSSFADPSYIAGFGSLVGGSYTVSVWAKTDVAGQRQVIIGDWDSTNGANESFSIEFGGYNVDQTHINARRRDTSGRGVYIDGGVYSAGTWYHIVVSENMSLGNYARKIYMNGTLLSSDSGSGYIASGGKLMIGKTANNALYLRGAIDDLRIYNRQLSDSEVSALYTESTRCQ